MLRWFFVLSVCLPAVVASGATLLVLPDGSGPYTDIQTAVAAAADGDTVLLGDGVFTGDGNTGLVLAGRSLTFRSVAGDATRCTIDVQGPGARRFVTCTGGDGDEVVLEDLTIQNGDPDSDGGCVRATNLSLVIRRCRMHANRGIGWGSGGGAVAQNGGDLRLEDCVLWDNRAIGTPIGGGTAGGAVYAVDAHVSLQRCRFLENYVVGRIYEGAKGGAVSCHRCTLLAEDCAFVDNRVGQSGMGSFGGAVAIDEGQAEIRRSVFAGNEAGHGWGGAFSLEGYGVEGSALLANCTFVGNVSGPQHGTVEASLGEIALEACVITDAIERQSPSGVLLPGDAAAGYSTTITATDCDIWGNGENWAGSLEGQGGHDGNFSANPCFCDTTAGDFHLCADSWCAPDNNVAHPGVLVGALPVGCEACDCDEGPVAVSEDVPDALQRLDVAPNPFNPRTTVSFTLPAAGHAKLTIYDSRGMEVARMVNEALAAGLHTVDWDGRSDAGTLVPSGVYLCRFESGDQFSTRKLALLR
jgi:hypothetical protein